MTKRTADELQASARFLFADGQRDEALIRFQEAAALYEAEGDVAASGEALNNVGVLQRMAGRLDQGTVALERAIAAFEQVGDAHRRAMAKANLADVLDKQGAHQQAAANYEAAADDLARSGDAERQAQVLRAYSLLQLRRRWWLPALDLMVRSLAVRPRRSLSQQLLYRFLRFARDFIAGQR
ncbi:MAG: hypothetical protein R3300_14315 [Candidatus Promineifilaceae bacterium]|nr:hypothetical protein [Candidatus Promineifilaceae bacterium]